MSDLPRAPDVATLASGVGLAIAASPELEEVLAVVARTTAEALGAEQCQIQARSTTPPRTQ